MKIKSVILKSLKEQIRSFWTLLLILSMGPFFIFLFYLITESTQPHYEVLLLNNDTGAEVNGDSKNHGDDILQYFSFVEPLSQSFPFTIEEVTDRSKSIEQVKTRKADALIIIEDSFSKSIEKQIQNVPSVEIVGDLSYTNYLISAVWANEFLNEYIVRVSNESRTVEVNETALGISANIDEFDMMVPGILIISLIMLMFTASISLVSEVENHTIIRLKLSKITAFEFLTGLGIVQLLIGLASLLLTLFTAILLGFQYEGSLFAMIAIGGLTSLSIISFSVIISAFTKSANEVLVVGNFPMFLFMFFTGAAFPIESNTLFTLGSYPVNLQSLMSPTHAVSALNKTLVLSMDFTSVIPEVIALIILTILYFVIGALIFRRRHLKLS